MKQNKENTTKISRKKFLKICGSVIAGGSILGISSLLLRNKFNIKGEIYTNKENLVKSGITSPYKLVSSFSIPNNIEGFESYNNKLIIAASNNIYVYDEYGSLINNFGIGSNIRDISVKNNMVYILFSTRIEIYNLEGEWQNDWEACSDMSDYCSFAVTDNFIFVTDAANKNICKYTTEGDFVKFIQSPNKFIVPSHSFGITYIDGTIYCSNPGRHQIESYTINGDYIGTFGKAGGAAGMFCGCCNPVYITKTSTGELITSEKGNPRISCYSQDGDFRSILLDDKMLGGGNTAYKVKVQDDILFIAGKNMVSTFKYDNALVIKTACSTCNVKCPLREGISI